jgi:hypothetical protein
MRALVEVRPEGGTTMRRIAFAFICSLLSGPPLGAAAAALPVSGERVDLRAGPAGAPHDGSAGAPGPRGPALAQTEALAPGVTPVDLERFRDTVAYFNSRAKSVAGVDLFSEVAAIRGGTVQLRASDGWARLPPAAQRNYVTALLERWAAATGRADHRRVQIVDPGGQVLMEHGRP